MKFYLAGPYGERRRLAADAVAIAEASGWRCTSRWLSGAHDGMLPSIAATEDVDDVRAAQVLVVDADRPSTRGGMWVEVGIAVERQMPIVVVLSRGRDREADDEVRGRLNVFAHLPQVRWVPGGPEQTARELLDIEARIVRGRLWPERDGERDGGPYPWW